MEDLLHERLRGYSFEATQGRNPIEAAKKDFCVLPGTDYWEVAHLFQGFAKEIERYYIPRPRFEDGEPVQFGDEPDCLEIIDEISFFANGSVTIGHDGNTFEIDGFVKRPTPKVCDADGVAYERGQHVWHIKTGEEYVVIDLPTPDCYQSIQVESVERGYKTGYDPNRLTHERPVFDAEGVRICKGDTVWHVCTGQKAIVTTVYRDDQTVVEVEIAGHLMDYEPSDLTHREPDSIESIAQYAHDEAVKYAGCIEPLNNLADRLTALIERGA